MLSRHKWLLEGFLWIGLFGALGFLFVGVGRREEILLLDRPRQAMTQPDWILRYLTVTQTPFYFKEGFVCLQDTPEVRRRLLALVDLLSRSLSAVAQNERSLLDPERFRPVALTLSSSGSLEILPESKTWNQTGGRAQRMQQLAWQREDLIGQYQTVLSAVQTLYPSAVGAPTTLPAPIQLEDRRPAPPAGAVRGPGTIQPVSADEVIELSDVEADQSNSP